MFLSRGVGGHERKAFFLRSEVSGRHACEELLVVALHPVVLWVGIALDGALVGGLVIGVAEEVSSYPWIGTEPLLNPGYKAGIAFTIMVGMLLWRPSGLFKGKV